MIQIYRHKYFILYTAGFVDEKYDFHFIKLFISEYIFFDQ